MSAHKWADWAVDQLSDEQVELMELRARGLTVDQVADVKGYSRGWTYALLRTVRETLSVETDVSAVVLLLALGRIEFPNLRELI